MSRETRMAQIFVDCLRITLSDRTWEEHYLSVLILSSKSSSLQVLILNVSNLSWAKEGTVFWNICRLVDHVLWGGNAFAWQELWKLLSLSYLWGSNVPDAYWRSSISRLMRTVPVMTRSTFSIVYRSIVGFDSCASHWCCWRWSWRIELLPIWIFYPFIVLDSAFNNVSFRDIG